MSEYQYYEFQAIDRPLTPQEQATLRKYSSRATSQHDHGRQAHDHVRRAEPRTGVGEHAMTTAQPHKWAFKPHFRRHAFGWRSQPAIQRVKEAVAEIKKVVRTDAVLAAEGAVALIERLAPALENIDSS